MIPAIRTRVRWIGPASAGVPKHLERRLPHARREPLPKSSQAALISTNDPVHGAGSITTDTVSGLDWLDWTKSTNRSVNTVLAQLGPGGEFAGFRYATNGEVATLFTNAGIAHFNQAFGLGFFPSNIPAVPNLMTLLGMTDPLGSELESLAFTADEFDENTRFIAGLVVLNPAGGTASAAANTRADIDGVDAPPVSTVGHALVRVSADAAPVPEPGSLILLASAALPLWFASRRRSKRKGSKARPMAGVSLSKLRTAWSISCWLIPKSSFRMTPGTPPAPHHDFESGSDTQQPVLRRTDQRKTSVNNTFKTIRAALLSAAFVAVSSTAAFGQLQIPGTSDVEVQVRNAVAFEMVCGVTVCTDPVIYKGPVFSVPRGYRLVVTQITTVTSSAPLLEFEGTLSGQHVRHFLQFSKGVTSLKCFVVVDSILSSPGTTNLIGNSGTTSLYFSGYLVKM